MHKILAFLRTLIKEISRQDGRVKSSFFEKSRVVVKPEFWEAEPTNPHIRIVTLRRPFQVRNYRVSAASVDWFPEKNSTMSEFHRISRRVFNPPPDHLIIYRHATLNEACFSEMLLEYRTFDPFIIYLLTPRKVELESAFGLERFRESVWKSSLISNPSLSLSPRKISGKRAYNCGYQLGELPGF
jgi:hypothetical protein